LRQTPSAVTVISGSTVSTVRATPCGEATLGDGPHELVGAGDAEPVEELVEAAVSSTAVDASSAAPRTRNPFGHRHADAVQGALPGAVPAATVGAGGVAESRRI
jgi:hypothetical protein